MLTTQYARTIPDVRFNAVDPGQTATEFTGRIGQSVEAAVRIAALGPTRPPARGDRPHRRAPLMTAADPTPGEACQPPSPVPHFPGAGRISC
ncbi:hypothetical protein C8K36_11617 [Rhodococcus sp. OK519]|nr:hypothetical protein C8K36_11617 [Rhodococcus sp. OK519]